MSTKTDYTINAINELAIKLTKNGFTVYLSKSKTYGVYSHINASNCIYFQWDLFEGFKFTSVCKPSRQHGTGCQLDISSNPSVIELGQALNNDLPKWYRRPSSDQLTLKEYLSGWFQSENYELFEV